MFFTVIYRTVELTNIKKRLKPINENLQILHETSKDKRKEPEIKLLFGNTKTVFENVQKKYQEVANKTREILIQKGNNYIDNENYEKSENSKVGDSYPRAEFVLNEKEKEV